MLRFKIHYSEPISSSSSLNAIVELWQNVGSGSGSLARIKAEVAEHIADLTSFYSV